MKTLFEKLSEKNKAKLASEIILYPSIGVEILKSLEKEFWVDLTILEANTICIHLIGKTVSILDLDNLFNETRS